MGDSVEYEIELKGFGENFILRVIDAVKQFNLLEKTEFTSPSLYTLQKVKQLNSSSIIGMFIPKIQVWMSIELGQKIALNELLLGNIDVAHCTLDLLNVEFIKKLRNKNKKVHAANCDTEEDLKKAFDLIADQLSTNKLELALAIRKEFTE